VLPKAIIDLEVIDPPRAGLCLSIQAAKIVHSWL
jgi:hypothetical protein